MFSNGFITSWQGFLQALESRFAPTFYDDPKGALFKLVQRGSVNDYLTEFERLANRVVGLPPPFLLSCFISGLNPELRREVLALFCRPLPSPSYKKISCATNVLRSNGPSSLPHQVPLPASTLKLSHHTFNVHRRTCRFVERKVCVITVMISGVLIIAVRDEYYCSDGNRCI